MVINPVVGGSGSEITTAAVTNNSSRSLSAVQLYNQMPICGNLGRRSTADVMVGSMIIYGSASGSIQVTGQLINLGLINGNYYIQVNGAGTIAESGPSGD